MGTTKSHIFNAQQNQLAAFFRVLAHPARIAILQYISSQKGCICNEIVAEVGLAQPTVSQHLKELKNLGILQGEIDGKRICYCIDPLKWKEIRTALDLFFHNTETHCC